jgi:hypothetical protein
MEEFAGPGRAARAPRLRQPHASGRARPATPGSTGPKSERNGSGSGRRPRRQEAPPVQSGGGSSNAMSRPVECHAGPEPMPPPPSRISLAAWRQLLPLLRALRQAAVGGNQNAAVEAAASLESTPSAGRPGNTQSELKETASVASSGGAS